MRRVSPLLLALLDQCLLLGLLLLARLLLVLLRRLRCWQATLLAGPLFGCVLPLRPLLCVAFTLFLLLGHLLPLRLLRLLLLVPCLLLHLLRRCRVLLRGRWL